MDVPVSCAGTVSVNLVFGRHIPDMIMRHLPVYHPLFSIFEIAVEQVEVF